MPEPDSVVEGSISTARSLYGRRRRVVQQEGKRLRARVIDVLRRLDALADRSV